MAFIFLKNPERKEILSYVKSNENMKETKEKLKVENCRNLRWKISFFFQKH